MGKRREDGTWEDACLAKVAPNEPIFVLRAQDATAPMLVDLWATFVEERARMHEQNGTAAHNAYAKPLRAKAEEARACAEAMRRWPTRKLPD